MASADSIPRSRQWPIRILAVAGLLSTGGIVWLAVKASGQMPEWARAGALSPLALRCLAIIVVGVILLAAVAMILLRVRRTGAAGPRDFHADQRASAAIEMALLFPFALMIFLVIIQATLLFNANMVVHYSAFAAARMAVVVVPMNLGDINLGQEPSNLVWPCTEDSQGPSEKIEMIRRAAVLALVPVSASLRSDAPDEMGQTVSDETHRVFGQFSAKDQGWMHRVKAQYDYANLYTKIELAKPAHWLDGDPDNDCPYAYQRRDQWTNWGWTYVPYCSFYHSIPPIWDYWYWEDLHVRVTYPFLLEVPYASRFLGDPFQIPDRQGAQYASTIRVMVTLSNEGGPELQPKDYNP